MNTYSNTTGYLNVGDVLSVQKGLFTHLGVVVPGGILENRPGFRERVVSLFEFTGGLTYQVRSTGADAAL